MRNSAHVWSSPGAPSETSSRRPAPSASLSPYVPYSSPSPRGSLSAFCRPGQEGAASTTKWSVTSQDKPLVSAGVGTDCGRRLRGLWEREERAQKVCTAKVGCGLGQTPDGATDGVGAMRSKSTQGPGRRGRSWDGKVVRGMKSWGASTYCWWGPSLEVALASATLARSPVARTVIETGTGRRGVGRRQTPQG